MPLPAGTRYRYKPGTKMRLAFQGNKAIEVKNMATGDTKMLPEANDKKKRPYASLMK